MASTVRTFPLFVLFAIMSILALMPQAQAGTQSTPNPKILVVMTNHDQYPTRTDTTGLWLTELTHFTDRVEAAGFTTVFTSPLGGKVPLDERSLGWMYMDDAAREHLESPEFLKRLETTIPASEIDPQEYAAIYFTGGHGVMWDFRDNTALQQVAESIYLQGGVLSAVCHGVAGLIELENEQGDALINGRNITGFSNQEEFFSGMRDEVPFFLQDELTAKGALYEKSWLPFKSFVLTDGRIVTGQNPSSAAAVAEAVLAVMGYTE